MSKRNTTTPVFDAIMSIGRKNAFRLVTKVKPMVENFTRVIPVDPPAKPQKQTEKEDLPLIRTPIRDSLAKRLSNMGIENKILPKNNGKKKVTEDKPEAEENIGGISVAGGRKTFSKNISIDI